MKQLIKRKEFVTMLLRKLEDEEYARRLSRRYNFWDLYWIIKAIYECMTDVLRNGDKLFIADCFVLQPKLKPEKYAGNFGHPCIVPEYYIPHFKPFKRWKDICKGLDLEEMKAVQEEGEKRANGKDDK